MLQVVAITPKRLELIWSDTNLVQRFNWKINIWGGKQYRMCLSVADHYFFQILKIVQYPVLLFLSQQSRATHSILGFWKYRIRSKESRFADAADGALFWTSISRHARHFRYVSYILTYLSATFGFSPFLNSREIAIGLFNIWHGFV